MLHHMRHSDMAQGYLCALIGLSLFAMKGIVIKLAYDEQLDALVTLTWRMIIALPFYVVIGLWMWNAKPEARKAIKNPRMLWMVLLCGILSYYVSSFLDFKGLEYVSAQYERLTLYTYPFFVLFFSYLLIGARITKIAIVALLLSYAGIAMIFVHDMPNAGDDYVIGSFYVIGAALVFAFQQVLSKPVIERVGSRLFTSVAMVAASVAMFVHFAAMRPIHTLAISMDAFWLMVILATFCTVAPTYLMNEAVRRIGPQHASSVGGVGPVVTIIAAVIILDETFTLWHAAGTALVLLGVGLFTRHKS